MKKRKKTARTCQTRRGCLNSVLMWRRPDQRRRVAAGSDAAESSATRSPVAGLEPSGTLVIQGDAAAPVREGGLLLPLATGPDELREACAATSGTGAPPRPRPPAGPRVRSARPSGRCRRSAPRPRRMSSASRRCRRRCAYSARSSAVGPLSHASRRLRSRAAHASISAWVGSRPSALSVIGGPRRLDRRSGHVHHPLASSRIVPEFRERRVYARAARATTIRRPGSVSARTGRTRSS